MKLPYILPVLLALPMGAFADSGFSHIRPFVGYDFSLAGNTNVKIKQSDQTIVKTESFAFNDNNVGSFGFGVELDDVGAIYVTPSVERVKTRAIDGTTTTSKMTEIDTALNIYLTRKSNFKPFVSLSAGYISMDGDFKTSGAAFGLGLGCKQYINDNVYLFANAGYNFSTEMDVKQVNGAPVTNVDMRVSGFDLSIGAGYRF